MDDQELIARIHELVEDEHDLERRAATEGPGLTTQDQERLQRLEVQLDQCWDLLRQRRARRHVGVDPDTATVRPESTVERYLQ